MSLLYNSLRIYIQFAKRMYFKKIQVQGKHHVPKNGPVIFAANHQNAFLDAVLVSVSSPRKPHFLTRGDVFKNPIADKILRSLRMRPIYRFRDGIGNLKRNKATFEECFDVLESGESLGIFPEGNHSLKFYLRNLQKGCAKIVYESELRNNFELGVKIVPVGIQYYGNQHARSRVLVQFGEALDMDDLKELRADPTLFQKALTGKLAQAMQPLILNIPEKKYHSISTRWKKFHRDERNLLHTLKNDKKIISLPSLDKEPKKDFRLQLIRWLSFPIALYGAVNHIIIYPILSFGIERFVDDSEFWGSIKFVVGLVLLPILYAIQTLLLSPILGDYTGLYLLTLPLSGLFFRDFIAPYRTRLIPFSKGED